MKREKGRFIPSLSETVKLLLRFKMNSLDDRKGLSQIAIKNIGIESVSKRLGQLEQSSKFEGFTSAFKKLLATFENMPQAPFRSHDGQLNAFYFDLYSNYFGEGHE